MTEKFDFEQSVGEIQQQEKKEDVAYEERLIKVKSDVGDDGDQEKEKIHLD